MSHYELDPLDKDNGRGGLFHTVLYLVPDGFHEAVVPEPDGSKRMVCIQDGKAIKTEQRPDGAWMWWTEPPDPTFTEKIQAKLATCASYLKETVKSELHDQPQNIGVYTRGVIFQASHEVFNSALHSLHSMSRVFHPHLIHAPVHPHRHK